MIEIYRDKTMIKQNELIEKIDLTFNSIVYNLDIKEFDKTALKSIDEAVYDGNGFVVTPFGRTMVQNISTGCKTLILINHSIELGNKIISINECGKNVLDIIFALENCRVYSSFLLIPRNYSANKIVRIHKNKRSKDIKLCNYFGGK